MSDIQSLIKMLQSDNPDKRYDACEELRVASTLPEEAIEALRSALNDSSPEVVEAAFRALAVHTQIVNEKEQFKAVTKTLENSPVFKSWWPLIGFLAGLFPSLISYIYFFVISEESSSLFAGLATLCMGPVGITCGMIGAYIGKRNNKKTWITAVLGAILGAGLFYVFAVYTCLFCQ